MQMLVPILGSSGGNDVGKNKRRVGKFLCPRGNGMSWWADCPPYACCYLIGGAGQDTYLYNKGDGIDTIYDTQADKNILRFGAGVDSNNIKLRLGSLMLNLGNGDAIHINNEDQASVNGFDRNNVFNSSAIGSFEFAPSTGSGRASSVRMRWCNRLAVNDASYAVQLEWRVAA